MLFKKTKFKFKDLQCYVKIGAVGIYEEVLLWEPDWDGLG